MSRTPMPFKNANVQFTRRVIFGASFALASSSWVRFSADARQSTPVASPSGDDDAVQLLEDAAQAMAALDTFAFDVVTAQGETVILEGLTLQGIQGVVRRPTDFETSVTVEIPFASIDLTAVSVDGEVWINVPSLGGSDSGWQSFGNSDGLLSLLNPDVLILEAVRYLDDATIDGEGDLDGIDVKYVTGTVNFQAIAQSFVGDTETLPTEIAEGPADVTVAVDVDVDNLVREIEIVGPLLASEASDVIRLVTFSAFNEPVDIQQPEI